MVEAKQSRDDGILYQFFIYPQHSDRVFRHSRHSRHPSFYSVVLLLVLVNFSCTSLQFNILLLHHCWGRYYIIQNCYMIALSSRCCLQIVASCRMTVSVYLLPCRLVATVRDCFYCIILQTIKSSDRTHATLCPLFLSLVLFPCS